MTSSNADIGQFNPDDERARTPVGGANHELLQRQTGLGKRRLERRRQILAPLGLFSILSPAGLHSLLRDHDQEASGVS
jgi:hypothetical protein